jgi:hypothetical protein
LGRDLVAGPSEAKNVAFRLGTLALLCYAQGRPAEAEALLKRALAIDEKVLGPEHPNTKRIRENLQSLQDDLARSKGAPSDARPK